MILMASYISVIVTVSPQVTKFTQHYNYMYITEVCTYNKHLIFKNLETV
jgi:hypothetical protein